MDEPLGSLDSQMRGKLQSEIMSLWERTRKTVLMVTHDIEEAVFLSDRVALLGGAPGSVRKIIDIGLPRPRDRSVKSSPAFQEIKKLLADMIMED
jgi:NitT/TauT family transport system ATP-binding protein